MHDVTVVRRQLTKATSLSILRMMGPFCYCLTMSDVNNQSHLIFFTFTG